MCDPLPRDHETVGGRRPTREKIVTRFHTGPWAHFVEPNPVLVDNGRLLLEEREGGPVWKKKAVQVRAMAVIDDCIVGNSEWLPREGRSPYEAARDMCMFYFGQSFTPAATDRHCELEALEIRLAQECEGMMEPVAVAALVSAFAKRGVIIGPPFWRPVRSARDRGEA